MSMWKPFTEPARRSIIEAHTIAQRFASPEITQDHVFVGIARTGGSPAAAALESFGVNGERVENAAERLMPHGKAAFSPEMTFTPQGKRMIERAFDEAGTLKHKYIGAEHLMLGYIAEYGAESQLLRELGLDPERLRERVLELVPENGEPASLDDAFEQLAVWKRRDPAMLWDALAGAVAEKDAGAVLAYAFLIAHREGWNAQIAGAHAVEEANRRFET